MSYLCVYLQGSLPAWLILTLLMFATHGNLQGNAGFALLLVIAFPGIWGAFNLPLPNGGWIRRLGSDLLFAIALGLGMGAVLLAARLTLHLSGLYAREIQSGNPTRSLLQLMSVPAVVFLVLRGMKGLSILMRQWGKRGCIMRGVGLSVVLVAVGLGVYLWAGRSYTGHATLVEPRPVQFAVLEGFDHDLTKWKSSDPSVAFTFEAGSLHQVPAPLTMFYTVTWQIPQDPLPQADGFIVRARSDAAITLIVEIQEKEGGKYRSWADLPAGDWTSLFLVDFLPDLNASDLDNRLDWNEVERANFYIYLEKPGANLWLDRIESVALDHSQKDPWLEAASQHFWIRYHARDQAVIQDVLQAGEARFDQISTTFGYRPVGRIPITLVSTHAELEQETRDYRPVYVNGIALPDSLILLTPLRYSPFFNHHNYDDIFELVPHELTHLMLGKTVGYPGFLAVPQWLNEGLAVYLSGQSVYPQNLRDTSQQDKLPSLQDLEDAFSGQVQIARRYEFAGSITSYLIKTYGTEKIPSLFKKLAQGQDFDSALQQVNGIDLAALDRNWQRDLSNGLW